MLRTQRKVKGGAAIHLRFRPDLAPVAVYNALHGGQPYARPRIILSVVQALKRLEEFLGVDHIKSRSIIPNKKGFLPLMNRLVEFDFGGGTPFREFPGVLRQILENYAQQLRVADGL